MARPSILKVTDNQMIRYLRNHFLLEDGSKASIRDVFSNQEFLKWSGFYKKSSMSLDYEMVSLGSVSHLLKRLKLNEKDLYDYYIKRGLIDPSVTFEMWSRKCNRGGKPNYANLQKDYKIYFIEHFNLDYVKCRSMSLDELKREAMKLYEALEYSIAEFMDDYEVFRNSFDIEDRVLSENTHINKGVDK